MRRRSPAPSAARLLPAIVLALAPMPLAAQRAFEHVRHEAVSCRACHGAGAEHRTLLVRSAADCAACHHAATRDADCRSCHRAAELPPPRELAVPLAFSVNGRERVRDLPFAHALHDGVPCRDCHQAAGTRRMERGCASCHERHHRPEAQCASCHTGDVRGAHGGDAHLACATAGCHAAAAAPAAGPSRTTCLLCHPAQVVHEPRGTCATCHRIPAAVAARGGAVARGPRP